MEFPNGQQVGHGLTNLGNSCFLAATVQCLTHLAPFACLSLSQAHEHLCSTLTPPTEVCAACALHKRIRSGLTNPAVHSPKYMYNRLQVFAEHFTRGQQVASE